MLIKSACLLAYTRLSPVVLIIVTESSTVRVQFISSHYRTCWTQQLNRYCINGSTTLSPVTSEIDCTGCPFSSAWSTRSVYWYSSVFTRWHQSTLQRWTTRFPRPLAEVISDPQRVAIWRYLDHARRLTDKEVFHLWAVTVELVATLCSWPISDNEAVLHTSEDFSVLPSILYLA